MNEKQKRALGVGGVAVGGVLLYRHLHSRTTASGGTMTNDLAQASHPVGSVTPFVPQAPIVVPPGESIYDPNSQNLLNTPSAIPPQSTTPSGPAYVVNVATPKTHSMRPRKVRPTKRPHGKGTSQHKHAKSIHKGKKVVTK